MKYGCAVAFAITILCLFYCLVRTKESKKKIAVVGRRVLVVAMISVASNLVQMFSNNEVVYNITYSIFFVSLDWLLYNVLCFTIEYTGFSIIKYVRSKAVWFVLAADSISLLLNPILGHAYTCVQVLTVQNELYYSFISKLPYYIHLGISYILVVLTILCLIVKIACSPQIYRRKYWVILIFLMFIVTGDAVHLIFKTVIDVSILGFAFAGIAVYYYSIVYVSNDLLNRLFSVVVGGLGDGILLFDMDGQCIYANSTGRKMIEVSESASVEEVDEVCGEWLFRNELSRQEDFLYEWTKGKKSQAQHIKVSLQHLQDQKQRHVGYIMRFQDWTVQANEFYREHQLATRDHLTKVYNKSYFLKRAGEYIRQNNEGEFLLVCSDIKNFKLINDVFGMETGDALLVKLAGEIRRRAVHGEIYGRLGNDRFGILLHKKYFSTSEITQWQQNHIYLDDDIRYPIHLYLGVYEVGDGGVPVSVMCERALMAIETIKGGYHQKVAYYDDLLRDSALREQELSAELLEALKEEQIKIYLQPQVVSDGSVPGAEVLVRWEHPERGLLMPSSFVEMFERNGMIAKLDQYVWEQACRQLQKWERCGHGDIYLSVNISPKDFYYLDIYKIFTELIWKYKIAPSNLKLEITETTVMENLEEQLALIKRLRAAGFIVEMDDFGSGYSSLNMLKDICVDVLKIDMAFLKKGEDEERGRNILCTIIELSNKLDMPVIMEGVETKEQVQFLTEMGCHIFQGFYFAKPMSVSQFEKTYVMNSYRL